MASTPDIVILAAGLGKRMRSSTPKVLHPVLARPMLHYVIDLALSVPHGAVAVVVGNGSEDVRKACADYPMVQFVEQSEQLGTGHAVLQTRPLLGGLKGSVIVLCGDVILLTPTTLQNLILARQPGTAAVVLSTRLENPKGYGRIIRGHQDDIIAIREEADCSVKERLIDEINSGIYLFDCDSLFSSLDQVDRSNAQNEYYLTDVISSLHRQGMKVLSLPVENASEVLGINDRLGLQKVEQVLQREIAQAWMIAGVSLENPDSTIIDRKSSFSADVRIEGGCHIIDSKIASGVTIEFGSRIVRSTVGHGCVIKQGSYITDSHLGDRVSVGPYAHLRPKSRLEDGVKIGNFVEVKNSRVGAHSKASHLSYIGDATIGTDVNLGCGFITCNFDGSAQKHHTSIGDRVFVGSDSQTVAPVSIGADSYIASGTTVTQNVPNDSLVISRGRQVTKPGYGTRLRGGK